MATAQSPKHENESPKPRLVFNTISTFTLLHAGLLLLGNGGSLLLRVYFIHGGRRLWLSTLLQICAWPLLLLPLSLSPKHLRLSLPPPLYLIFSIIGLLFALDCYLYSLASAYLPLSTSSILVSSQLAFTAGFAFILVRQRFSAYSLNAVVLLTVGSVVLGLGASSDRPEGESEGKYYIGFATAVAAAALAGLIFPLMERAMRWCRVEPNYTAVMEMQLVTGVSGTIFCLVGMAINKDFQAISREAREFGLGETKYYMILVWDSIFWQFINVGMIGLISGASSLFCGIMLALLLPLSEVLAVIFLHEKFDGSKGVALVLSLWGFVSYLYGENKQNRNSKAMEDTTVVIELPS